MTASLPTSVRSRRRATCSLGLLLLSPLALGCETGQRAVPRGPSSTSAPLASAATSSPSAGGGSWDAGGDSFGVERTDWPTTVAGAEALIKRLPATFSGHAGETFISPAGSADDGGEGAAAGVDYGGDIALTIAEAYTTTDTENGEPEAMTATDLMAAHFLLGYACADESYRGTARPTEDRLGPAPEEQPDGSVWFSCRIDNAEGDESYTGHVVGWTSGRTAWQVLAPDPDTLRSLVTVIHDSGS